MSKAALGNSLEGLVKHIWNFLSGRRPSLMWTELTHFLPCLLNMEFAVHTLWPLFCPQCPDSQSKKDLDAYLQRIALYCHQLNITSKVKADVQSVSGELIVSGVRYCCLFWYTLYGVDAIHVQFFVCVWYDACLNLVLLLFCEFNVHIQLLTKVRALISTSVFSVYQEH